MCLWVQRRGQKVRLIPQRIKMDKRKALALLCGVVSQEPTAFENLYSLFLGLREVRTKENKGCGVKGKVRQLSKPCFLESPSPFRWVLGWQGRQLLLCCDDSKY